MADQYVVGAIVAITGVLVGGGINFALDTVRYKREKKSRNSELRRRKLERAISLLYKIAEEMAFYKTQFDKALQGKDVKKEYPFKNGLPILNLKSLLSLYGHEFDVELDELLKVVPAFQMKMLELSQAYMRNLTIDVKISEEASIISNQVSEICDRIEKKIVKIFRDELIIS